MAERLIAGIDVGGTYTDAVLLERAGSDSVRVLSVSKKPTAAGDPGEAIMAAFESLFEEARDRAPSGLERVVVSTTVCTNAVAMGNFEPVGLAVMPGPGLSPDDLMRIAGIDGRIFGLAELRGYVDHRGREVEPVDRAQVETSLRGLRSAGFENLAIAGKFCVRNPGPELEVGAAARAIGGFGHITMGHTLSGLLNFPRRVATACLNSAVASTFSGFVSALERAFAVRGVSCPVMLLKADGGTMDIVTARSMPVKSILSGPAASINGSLALAPIQGPGVTIDIGGSTADASFFIDGAPLFEAGGAVIAGRRTLVRAMYSRSLALGGDTPVSALCDPVLAAGRRMGPAAAFGGPAATLTDALNVAGLAEAGDVSRSRTAMGKEARLSGMDAAGLAARAVEQAADMIARFVRTLLDELRRGPAYTVCEAVNPLEFRPETVVGIGAPAASLIPLVASRLGATPVVPPLAAVGNAVGAGLAVPTAEATLRIDTALGFVTVVEDGLREESGNRFIREPDAAGIATRHVLRRAPWARAGDVEVVEMESYNVIRDFHTSGRIFDVKAQVRPRMLRLCGPGEVTERRV